MKRFRYPFLLSPVMPRAVARQGAAKKLPPFDKGGQGGIYPRPPRKIKFQPISLFQRGKWRGAIASCGSRGVMLFLGSVAVPAAKSKDTVLRLCDFVVTLSTNGL
jgi:hypothetical protein